MSVWDRKLAHGDSPRPKMLVADAIAAAEAARARIDDEAADLSGAGGIGQGARIDVVRLLASLVAAVEDDLRERIIAQLHGVGVGSLIESLAAGEIAIAAPILDRAGLLGDAALMAELLHRVERRRIVERLTQGSAPPQDLIESLMHIGDEPLTGLAMALIVARSRRDGRTDAATVGSTDLPAELQYRLVWRVAAALRRYAIARGVAADADLDRAIVTAATAALAGYDEDDSLEGRAMRIARRLHTRRRLNDALIVRALAEAEVTVATAGLAVRAAIDFADAWDMVADPDPGRLTILLRAIGMMPIAAAEILNILAAAGVQDPAQADLMAGFDAIDPLAAREALRPLQMDAGYRQALAEFDGAAIGTAWR